VIVHVNGETRELKNNLTVTELVELLDFPTERIAIEVNHVVIRRNQWAATRLSEDDKIEIVHFVGGGTTHS